MLSSVQSQYHSHIQPRLLTYFRCPGGKAVVIHLFYILESLRTCPTCLCYSARQQHAAARLSLPSCLASNTTTSQNVQWSTFATSLTALWADQKRDLSALCSMSVTMISLYYCGATILVRYVLHTAKTLQPTLLMQDFKSQFDVWCHTYTNLRF
jgi:hypothetical protein